MTRGQVKDTIIFSFSENAGRRKKEEGNTPSIHNHKGTQVQTVKNGAFIYQEMGVQQMGAQVC